LADLYKEALFEHRKYRGKIAVESKVPLQSNKDLSLFYSPGVAFPCKEIAADVNKIYDYTIKGNTVAVVSNGTAVLGLGNIGAHAALPVMEGKAVLFKKFAAIDAFPICLDTTSVKDIVVTLKMMTPVFGGINLEDIASPSCFYIEKALQYFMKKHEKEIQFISNSNGGILSTLTKGTIVDAFLDEASYDAVIKMATKYFIVNFVLNEYFQDHIKITENKTIEFKEDEKDEGNEKEEIQ